MDRFFKSPTSLIEHNQRPVPLEISLVTSNKMSNNIKILKSLPPANEVSDQNYKPLSKPVFVNDILTKESKLQLKALFKNRLIKAFS